MDTNYKTSYQPIEYSHKLQSHEFKLVDPTFFDFASIQSKFGEPICTIKKRQFIKPDIRLNENEDDNQNDSLSKVQQIKKLFSKKFKNLENNSNLLKTIPRISSNQEILKSVVNSTHESHKVITEFKVIKNGYITNNSAILANPSLPGKSIRKSAAGVYFYYNNSDNSFTNNKNDLNHRLVNIKHNNDDFKYKSTIESHTSKHIKLGMPTADLKLVIPQNTMVYHHKPPNIILNNTLNVIKPTADPDGYWRVTRDLVHKIRAKGRSYRFENGKKQELPTTIFLSKITDPYENYNNSHQSLQEKSPEADLQCWDNIVPLPSFIKPSFNEFEEKTKKSYLRQSCLSIVSPLAHKNKDKTDSNIMSSIAKSSNNNKVLNTFFATFLPNSTENNSHSDGDFTNDAKRCKIHQNNHGSICLNETTNNQNTLSSQENDDRCSYFPNKQQAAQIYHFNDNGNSNLMENDICLSEGNSCGDDEGSDQDDDKDETLTEMEFIDLSKRIHLIGAYVKLDKNSFLSLDRKKSLRISFDQTEPTTYEYPSEQSLFDFHLENEDVKSRIEAFNIKAATATISLTPYNNKKGSSKNKQSKLGGKIKSCDFNNNTDEGKSEDVYSDIDYNPVNQNDPSSESKLSCTSPTSLTSISSLSMITTNQSSPKPNSLSLSPTHIATKSIYLQNSHNLVNSNDRNPLFSHEEFKSSAHTPSYFYEKLSRFTPKHLKLNRDLLVNCFTHEEYSMTSPIPQASPTYEKDYLKPLSIEEEATAKWSQTVQHSDLLF
ncbi:general transcriptional corepressor trfA-like [Gordionus sp. m RMFG-2023]|uniref:general transcriptional corepressor trfA-like n=1 Tax=Gordionus sp. m RMFG-2023 TaxID=3053472 RepID=UPI0031FD4B84